MPTLLKIFAWKFAFTAIDLQENGATLEQVLSWSEFSHDSPAVWSVGCSNNISNAHTKKACFRTRPFSLLTIRPSWAACLLSVIPSIAFLSCLSGGNSGGNTFLFVWDLGKPSSVFMVWAPLCQPSQIIRGSPELISCSPVRVTGRISQISAWYILADIKNFEENVYDNWWFLFLLFCKI